MDVVKGVIILLRVVLRRLNTLNMFGHQLVDGGVILVIGRKIQLWHLVSHLCCLLVFSIYHQGLR